jgi:hypothetical protein
LANFVNKKPKRGQTFKKFVFLLFSFYRWANPKNFELFHTHKYRKIFFCIPNDIKKAKKITKGPYFFPQRANLSTGLAGKLYQELTTLPLPAAQRHS